jgi:hypothetical protein
MMPILELAGYRERLRIESVNVLRETSYKVSAFAAKRGDPISGAVLSK